MKLIDLIQKQWNQHSPSKMHPTDRHASPQAWRRLRKTMTDRELQDIAIDIANVLKEPVAHPIAFALIHADWDKADQR